MKTVQFHLANNTTIQFDVEDHVPVMEDVAQFLRNRRRWFRCLRSKADEMVFINRFNPSGEVIGIALDQIVMVKEFRGLPFGEVHEAQPDRRRRSCHQP